MFPYNLAILGRESSKLELLNLEGGSSVKISNYPSLGIITNDGEVYAVTWKEILKQRSDGTTEHLATLPVLDVFSWVVTFQKKIYIIQPDGKSMLCFDPAENSLTDDLPGCGLGIGFCASATDNFIYAMGGEGTATRSMKYDPLELKWKKKARMRKKRDNAAAATLDGKIYVMGGWPKNASVEYYNPGNNSWTGISNMNFGRKFFDACVVDDRLYAVGGDGEEKNGFYQHTIEVYDENKWTVVTKFQTKDYWIYSSFWPHGSHQPAQLWEKAISKPTTSSEKVGDKSESKKESTGATAGKMNELQQLEFQYIPLGRDEEIGPEGGNLSVDESSLTIRPKSLVDTQNLSISLLMDFQNLDLPADRIPVSPYLDVKFRDKLRLPAKATIPIWFMPSEDSDHGIKIYKRYHNEENKITWRELQNEVKVHDNMIEFEIDHFCGFIAMITDLLYWVRGEIRLSHGLFHRGENFLSVVCYQSPESLFRQMIAHLKEIGHKEIYSNRFVMKSTQEVPIRMECFDPPLHEFEPQQHLLTPSDIRASKQIQFPFLLQLLDEPKDAVKIKYIVNDFIAPFKVTLLDTKATSAVGIHLIGDRATVNIGDVSVHAGDKGDVSTVTNQGNNFVAGDASTVVNVPVGQLATENANITNQGTGNNFAGSQENTDRSVTAGKAIYGESTSSSVGENITVNRSRK